MSSKKKKSQFECSVCGYEHSGIMCKDFVDGVLKSSKSNACPCRHTAPCHEDCTCVNSFMSRGCLRCCSYGSDEQRKWQAERLAALVDISELSPALQRAIKHELQNSKEGK